jgi:cysteine desulfurase
MYIYLDNAATTKVDLEILDAYIAVNTEFWGNPSSTHQIGQKARATLEKARLSCAQLIGAKSQEIYFTATATETNNIGIQGVILESLKRTTKPHILISPLEHSSVSDFTNYANVDVEVYTVKSSGVCEIENIISSIRDETVLICLMLVSNEIGTIQPVAELAKEIAKINSLRQIKNLPKIYLHSDCVQAPLYIDLDFHSMGVDMAVISGHKLYAPRGAAILYLKEGVKIHKSSYGGGQERDMRSGTEDVAGINCLATALVMANENRLVDSARARELRDGVVEYIKHNLPEVNINGDLVKRTPNNLHITVPGIDEDSLVLSLDLKGFAVSSGSSCTSGAHKKSKIASILGTGVIGADLRISLGKYNTEEEVKLFCVALHDTIEELSNIKIK